MRGGRVRVRKELALIPIICVNSFAVVLMLFSGFGISAISSVPYAFNQVLPDISLGTWTYLFQGLLVCILFGVRRNIHIPYLFSFVVGFLFGIAVDVHESWIDILPTDLSWRILYFAVSYLLLCVGIAIGNKSRMPLAPTDLFPREFSVLTEKPYSRMKICFDVTCLTVTALVTWAFAGGIRGLGLGTVLAAFTMGKVIGKIGEQLDQRVEFI